MRLPQHRDELRGSSLLPSSPLCPCLTAEVTLAPSAGPAPSLRVSVQGSNMVDMYGTMLSLYGTEERGDW